MINRVLSGIIEKNIHKGKAILVFGARQSGKTTLVNSIASKFDNDCIFWNGDEPDIRAGLNNITSSELRRMIGDKKLLIIDEAQRIANIGLTIKLITDNIPGVQVIATGSSTFELADKIKEPLTGRKWEYYLFPLSLEEMARHHGSQEEKRQLENRLLYGSYPEVINNPGTEKRILISISDSVIYKDLLALEAVKKPSLIEKLLQALALQIGNEVSFNELGQIIGADKETAERYVYLLEQSFIIFRLRALSRNSRNEIKKSRKIYFYDNGIRNSIISNFAPLELRNDKGALWENYIISERLKYLHYHSLYCNSYFWRTFQQQEIDYLEEENGLFRAFEFKYTDKPKHRFPKNFSSLYPNSSFELIHSANYFDLLLPAGK